jgi:ribonuclease HII
MATPVIIKKFKTIKESKQLSAKQREAWYAKISAKRSGIRFSVSFVSPQMIDKRGIVPSIGSAIRRGLEKLKPNPERVRVLLDGGLKAPSAYVNQKTIIKGDEKETIIAIASVVAKVERDRLMLRLHKTYPAYGFDRHVGYGTKMHIEAIRNFGPTPIHRRTFIRGLDI